MTSSSPYYTITIATGVTTTITIAAASADKNNKFDDGMRM
jgi:hypothetical protein